MKKVLFFAAALCAVMFAVAGCEKNPGGNGNNGDGDNGGNGNDGWETVVAKPAKSFSVIDSEDMTLLEMTFTNDNKGRITKVDVKEKGNHELNYNTATMNFDYGKDTIRYIVNTHHGQPFEQSEYLLKDSLPISSIINITYGDPTSTSINKFEYRYDEAKHLIEIVSQVPIKLEWKDGCLKSKYLDGNFSGIIFKEKFVFYYDNIPSTISNFNPFSIGLFFSCLDNNFVFRYNDVEQLFNLLGKQSKYYPIKCEYHYAAYYVDGVKPGNPGDEFNKVKNTIRYEYEFNDDKTISKVKATFEEDGEITGECYYKFTY